MPPASDNSQERCEGCGALVPRVEGPVHRYMTSAPGCWAMHGEISARLLSDRGAIGFRQLCVDAYAVQHPGTPNPQAIQSVAGHLMSLHAQLERGLPSASAPALLQRATQPKAQYHWLEPPSFEGRRTIGHMLANTGDPGRAAREWASDAWQAWAAHHAQVRVWYDRLIGATRAP
ncbi:MAG: DUF5946 family protein [Hyphomicrobiales bacterium]